MAAEEKQRHGGWSEGRRQVGWRKAGCSFFLDENYLYPTLYNLAKKGGRIIRLTYVEDTFQLYKGRLHLCLNLHSAKHQNQTETTISSSCKYTI